MMNDLTLLYQQLTIIQVKFKLFQKRFQTLNRLCYIDTNIQMLARRGTVQSVDFV